MSSLDDFNKAMAHVADVDAWDDEGKVTVNIGREDGYLDLQSENYSVTDFKNDPAVVGAFSEVTEYFAANRGLGSALLDQATIGEQTDVAEMMRDDVARLGAPLVKANLLKDAPENVKASYRLLQERFDASSLTGVGEHLSAIVDYGTDVIFNPEMFASIAAVAAAVPTGGASIAGRVGAGAVAKKAGKELLAESVAPSKMPALVGIGAPATKKEALEQTMKLSKIATTVDPLKASALMGAFYGGSGSYVVQDLDVALDKKESISGIEVGTGMVLGAAFGAGLYGGGSYLGRKYFARGTDGAEEIQPTAALFDEALEGEFIPASGGRVVDDLERLLSGDTVDVKNVDDLNIDDIVADLGGGEQTKREIRDMIRAASDAEETVDGVKNRVKQGLYKITSNLSGNLFGKAAGVLTPITKLSGTAKILQEKLSHEFATGWKKSNKIIEKDLSEVQREVTGRFNEKFRAIVEDISLHAAKGTMSEDINEMLMLSLRSNKPIVSEKLDDATAFAVNKAAGQVRMLYKEMGVGLKEIGVIDDLVDNYIPRMWDRKAIEANPEKLAELLETKGGYAKGTGKKTVDDMLGVVDQIDAGGAGGHFFSAKRKLNQIENDADFQEFLNNDVLGSLNAYTFQAGKSIAKHRVLGVNNLGEFQKFWTARIQREMAAKGEKMSASEVTQIDTLYRTATGEGMERYGKKMQNAVDTYGFVNRVSMLGLATLSSLTEVFLNISKAGVRNSAKGFAEAMEISFKGVTKDLESTLKTNHGLTAKEAFSEMRKMSVAMDQAMAQQGNRLAGDDLMNDWMQDKSNKFFRITLLDQWTKFVQTTSYVSGKNLINENLEALAANGSRKLDRKHESMIGELAELGIDYKQGIEWLKAGAKKDNAFYDEQVLSGAARYSNSVVLQPTAMSGLKPLLFSNPKSAILFQLLGYPVAFTNTVMKGAAKALVKDPVRNTPKILAAATLMTGMARWTNYVRSDGRSEEGKDTDEILYNSIARWGGNGIMLDSFNRARTSSMYTQSSLPYATMAMGPAGSDAISLMQQGIVPTIGNKVPFISGSYFGKEILGEENVSDYKEILRAIEKRYVSGALVQEFPEESPKVGYNKGGEVLVPNAPAEPDERIDKMTGQPYNMQAGSAFMDTTDPFKVMMNKGGAVKRRNYNVGGLLIGKGAAAVADLAGETANKVFKNLDGLFNKETVQNAANNIDRQINDLNLDTANPKFATYVDSLVVNNLEPDNYRSIYELEEIPQWKKAMENQDSSQQATLWSEAQTALGITERKRVALENIRDLQQEIDPNAALESVIPNSLGNLTTAYKNVKVDVTPEEIAKVNIDDLDPVVLANTEDFLRRTIQENDSQSLSAEGLESVVEKTIVKLMASGEVDFSKFNTPKLDFDVGVPGIAPTKQSIEARIANSEYKDFVYRGTTSYTGAAHDIAFAFARETGVHTGTEGQATSILIRGLPHTALKKELKERIDSGTLTREEKAAFFSDPDLIEGKFVPQLDEATEIVDDVPLDVGYFGKFGDPFETEIKPLTMNRGYINVEKPLLIDSDMAGWEAERLLTDDGGGFSELFMEQLLIDDINLTPFQDSMLDDLYARAEYITESMYTEIYNTGVGTQAARPSNVYEALKSDLIRAEFNIDFREFLQDLGYDSIKYRNVVETSLEGESDYSYILFNPDQFIPVISKLLDSSDVPVKKRGKTGLNRSKKQIQIDGEQKDYRRGLRTNFFFDAPASDKTRKLKASQIPEGTAKLRAAFKKAWQAKEETFKLEGKEYITEDLIQEGTKVYKATFNEGGVASYEIQAGDTLSSIARQRGTTAEQLAADNEIADPNMIYAGRSINVPEAGSLEPVQAPISMPEPQQAAPSPAPEIQPAAPSIREQVASATTEAVETVTQSFKDATTAIATKTASVSGAASELSDQVGDVLATRTKSVVDAATALDFGSRGRTAENTSATTSDSSIEMSDIKEGAGKALKALKNLVSIDADKLRAAVAAPETDISDVKLPDFSSEGRTAENTTGATNEPASAPIPTMIKQFLYDVTGGDKKLTEKDLLAPELEFLTTRAISLAEEGKNKIEYKDYNTEGEGQSQYSDVGGGGGVFDFFTKLNDPAYSMKTTLGQAEIKTNDKGETIIVDQYNFNDSDGAFSLLQFLKGIKNAGFSPYAQARNIARELGSEEGEGSVVEINLGKLNKKESKELLASL